MSINIITVNKQIVFHITSLINPINSLHSDGIMYLFWSSNALD